MKTVLLQRQMNRPFYLWTDRSNRKFPNKKTSQAYRFQLCLILLNEFQLCFQTRQKDNHEKKTEKKTGNSVEIEIR